MGKDLNWILNGLPWWRKLVGCWKRSQLPYSPAPYPDVSYVFGSGRGFKRKKTVKLFNLLCNQRFKAVYFIFDLIFYAHSMYFFVVVFWFLTTTFFVAFRHVLHDLSKSNHFLTSFVLGTRIVSSLWIVSAGEGDVEVNGEEINRLVWDALATENEVSHV